MKKSIASVCLSGDLRQKFDAASRAGFTGMEIFENDLMLFDEAPSVVRRMASQARQRKGGNSDYLKHRPLDNTTEPSNNHT